MSANSHNGSISAIMNLFLKDVGQHGITPLPVDPGAILEGNSFSVWINSMPCDDSIGGEYFRVSQADERLIVETIYRNYLGNDESFGYFNLDLRKDGIIKKLSSIYMKAVLDSIY